MPDEEDEKTNLEDLGFDVSEAAYGIADSRLKARKG